MAAASYRKQKHKTMEKHLYTLLLALLMLGLQAQAQTLQVTGTVTDAANGAALPGVTVTGKGTQAGTVTDQYGKYTLRVQSEKTVLVFGFIGYITQEVKVGKKRVVDVQLQADTQALEEVVVTAHGRPKGITIRGVATSAVVSAPQQYSSGDRKSVV